MGKHCDCHPWSDDDERLWRLVKRQPATKAQWQALHNFIEAYRRLLIDDYKRAERAVLSSPPERSPDGQS